MDVFEWMAAGMAAIVTFIASKPFLWRVIITKMLKLGFRWILKEAAKYRETYPINSPEYLVAKEGSEAVKALIEFLAHKLGIYAYPQKHQEPKMVKKMIKNKVKETWKGRKKDMKKKRQSGGGMNYMPKMFIVLMLVVLVFPAIAVEPAPMIDGRNADWQYLKHYAIGVAWQVNNGDEHSIAFMSAVTYKDYYNFDIGLIDWEKVETSGDRWYTDLKPTAGISVDVFGVIATVPQIEPIVGWIPDCVGAGAGVYMDIDNNYDLLPIVYITASW